VKEHKEEKVEDFDSLCSRGSPSGEPLSWAKILPASRWERLAAATKSALGARPSRPSLVAWTPAVAVAAAMAFLWIFNSPARRVPDAPPEVLEQLDLFEHLDLLQNWDTARALPPGVGGAP